jgi:cytochrome c5
MSRAAGMALSGFRFAGKPFYNCALIFLRIEVISMAEQYSSKGIMVATIIVAIVLTAVVVPFSMKGEKSAADAGSSSADQAESRIQPVARLELAKAAPAVAAGPKDGATVFNSVCGACHNTGVAGAPKAGDKAAWAPRIAQGNASLYTNAIAGKGAMPPKGGAAGLSDDEIKGAVDHLLGLSK